MDEHGSNGSNDAPETLEYHVTSEFQGKPRRKRVLVKDVTSRVEALENRLVEISDELLKLDKRIQVIADSVAQERAWTSN